VTSIVAAFVSITAAVMTIFVAVIETMLTAKGVTAEFTVITADPREIVAAFTLPRFDVTSLRVDEAMQVFDFQWIRSDAPGPPSRCGSRASSAGEPLAVTVRRSAAALDMAHCPRVLSRTSPRLASC
jgi:hypothetical protein